MAASGEVDPVDKVAVVVLGHRAPPLPTSPHLGKYITLNLYPSLITSFTISLASSSTSLSLYLDTRKE